MLTAGLVAPQAVLQLHFVMAVEKLSSVVFVAPQLSVGGLALKAVAKRQQWSVLSHLPSAVVIEDSRPFPAFAVPKHGGLLPQPVMGLLVVHLLVHCLSVTECCAVFDKTLTASCRKQTRLVPASRNALRKAWRILSLV